MMSHVEDLVVKYELLGHCNHFRDQSSNKKHNLERENKHVPTKYRIEVVFDLLR